MSVDQKLIRNFSIIAHIDHGKSTLADRILGLGGVTNARTSKDQILDSMDIERERGITIKMNSATFNYKTTDGITYIYNLIDTPGHVDFTYEVSRSLAACEGVLLVVDASQGVEAQTLANLYLAMEANLRIIPVINKIDLPAADVPRCLDLIEKTLGLDPTEAIAVSAKTGLNVPAILESIAKLIPAPSGDLNAPLRAMIYDSYYDSYCGAVMKVRIVDGILRKGDRVSFMSHPRDYQVTEVGITAITNFPKDELAAGEVGYVIAGIKSVEDTRVGDTVTLTSRPASVALPGYRDAKPMVFAGLFPVNGEDYPQLKDAIVKLKMNDAALTFEPETSNALGFGYRVGYLGLLHMEIVQERLEREFNLALINSAPSVKYRITFTNGTVEEIDNPANWPDPQRIEKMEEPYVHANVLTPPEYVGNILALFQDKRGIQENMIYLADGKVQLIYAMPLSELIFEFYDKLKSCSRGYASLDYEPHEYRESDLVKVDILVNAEPVDALAMIVHRGRADMRGRHLVDKLKELIPRQQFQIPLQAAVGAKVIARENISALRKNVTAKCYGGDITRKKKLLEKQKEGKKRMKQIGSVEIPQEAFLALLKTDE
ncbi:MAG TPA: translation elongation factor 4 [Leptospiraceae bacterium]|nr:translation elongation factor 4 [Leptospiraceae bacterium]HMX55769.1 translation elongation factor 4 [Leptospiraceae bacterium]HNL68471.1 translation elongation factor 4 [Leptospiraceae bacterium]HNN60343.1 translation elongation factor 4 [Leptospiraceae bacterium]HNN76534.1 translation elongation factor 4 [Leptospiraceae bacterium]